MDAAYFKAAIPSPCVIFGVRLLPLSIGRYRLLKRFGCAFVSAGEESATFGDLALGIVICSMPVKEFLQLVEDPRKFTRELERFGGRIREEMRHDRHFNLFAKYGLFQHYLTENSQCPKYWNETEDESGGEGPSHWSHNLEITLRSIGYTSAEIEEGPLSKALADYFKHAENKGAIRLMTEAEIAQGEANEKLFASLMKGDACPASN